MKMVSAALMAAVLLGAPGLANATIDYTLSGLATEIDNENGAITETDNLPRTVVLSFDDAEAGQPCDPCGLGAFMAYLTFDPATHINDLTYGFGETDEGEDGGQFTLSIFTDIKFATPEAYVIGGALPTEAATGSADTDTDFMIFDFDLGEETDTNMDDRTIFSSIEGPLPAVPEPSTWAFLFAGLCGIAAASVMKRYGNRIPTAAPGV